MVENEISGLIIRSAIKIHRSLGPGLLESAYKECLCWEFSKTGLKFEKEKALPLIYEGIKMDCGYRADMLVENKVIIEIKSVEFLTEIHIAQVLTYLRLSGCKLGLLINFNVLILTTGIKRLVNNL